MKWPRAIIADVMEIAQFLKESIAEVMQLIRAAMANFAGIVDWAGDTKRRMDQAGSLLPTAHPSEKGLLPQWQ